MSSNSINLDSERCRLDGCIKGYDYELRREGNPASGPGM